MKLPWVSRAALDAAVREAAALERLVDRQDVRIRELEVQVAASNRELLALTARVVAPTPPPPPPVIAPKDPEVEALARIKDDVIERMAADFAEQGGMDAQAAREHAIELARLAETMYA